MAAAGIDKQTVDGLRVHRPGGAGGRAARHAAARTCSWSRRCRPMDVRATSIVSPACSTADLLDRETLWPGRQGARVDLAPIQASHAGRLDPGHRHPRAKPSSGQILNINADLAANELVQALQPYKIVFLTGTGGLLDGDGKLIDSINLSTEYEQLMAQPWLHSRHAAQDRADPRPADRRCRRPRRCRSRGPTELAKELFTHRGSGTLVRRGERCCASTRWDGLDLERLRALIESAFGRRLTPDYFETHAALPHLRQRALPRRAGADREDSTAPSAAPGQVRRRRRCAGRRPRPRGLARDARGRSRGCSGVRARTIRSTISTSAKPTAASRATAGTCSGTAWMAWTEHPRAVAHCRARAATLTD